jgi:hypothetical protein
MSFRAAVDRFQLANPLYAAAIVTFYAVDENGARAGLATLYRNPTGPQTVNNPQSLDSEGKLTAPIYHIGPLIAEVSGPNVETHSTGVIGARATWRGTWTTGSRYYTGDTLGDPNEPHTIYIATEDFTGGVSFAADLAALKIELRVKGGDTLYFTVDDAGMPASGETFRHIFADPATLLATAPNSYARALVASAGAAAWTIQKVTALGVVTTIGTLTFSTSATGAYSVAADVSFAVGDELRLVAPNPRNASLSGVALTMRLHRINP